MQKEKAESLTFENGNFLFKGKLRDLKEAVALKRFADDKTLRVLDRVLVKRYELPELSLRRDLDPHQKEGIRWILSRSRSYLAHAPGAGKTAQAIIASLHSKGEGCVLFIVPPNLIENWKREILKWDHGYAEINVFPKAGGSFIDWTDTGWHLCPDSLLTRPWVQKVLKEKKWRFIAVDEADRFKEPTSQRTIALFGGTLNDGTKTKGITRGARHVVLMSGSPMPNRPMELWAPTYALSPETIDFASLEAFGFKYCGAKLNDYGEWEFRGASNLEELNARLSSSFMHVVTEDQLGHSERLRSILYMDELKSSSGWDKMLFSNTRIYSFIENTNDGELATARKNLGLAKIPWVAQYVKERLENKNESILLFAWHREVCLGLARLLRKFNPGVIIGGVGMRDRELSREAFDRGHKRLVIGNIQALGVGHNFQKADRIVFAEFSWSDELNRQCEKRASRKGRDKGLPVRCDYICVPRSIDEPVLETLFRKQKTVKAVIG